MKDVQEIPLIDKANRIIDQNKTAIIGFIVLVLVVFAGFSIYSVYQQNYEEKAQSAFFEAERLHAVNQGAQTSTTDSSKKDAPAVKVDTTQVEDKLNSVMNDFKGTTAATQSAGLLAEIYLEKKDSAKAITTLERSYANFSGQLMDSLMALKLSGLYEQNKQCDKALPVLTKVYNSKVAELKPEALLRQALCEEVLGQKDKAKQSYQKLATEFSDSTQGQQAQKFLKIMDNNS